MAKRRNETFWNENLLSRGRSELKCRSFVEICTHLVAVGLEVEEQDVELREEINGTEKKKEISRSCLALVYINLRDAGKENAKRNRICQRQSKYLIFVRDRRTIFLPTEVSLTAVRQEIWHYIKTLRRHILLKTDLYTIKITVGLRWFSASEWSPSPDK